MSPRGNVGILAMTFLLGSVMVSTFRYRSFKDLDFKERLPFRYLVFGVGVMILVGLRPEVNLFLLFLTYATLGAVFGVLRLGAQKVRPNAYLPAHNPHDPDLIEDEIDEKHETKK